MSEKYALKAAASLSDETKTILSLRRSPCSAKKVLSTGVKARQGGHQWALK